MSLTNILQGYQGTLNPSVSASIANGQQISATIATGGAELCGIIIPAAFTGTALTFLACNTSSGTFVPVYNASGVVSYTVAPSRYVSINPNDFHGVAFLQIQSGSAEGAARTLIVSMKGL